jgi:hypothetical protein
LPEVESRDHMPLQPAATLPKELGSSRVRWRDSKPSFSFDSRRRFGHSAIVHSPIDWVLLVIAPFLGAPVEQRKQRTRNRRTVNLRKPADYVARLGFHTFGAVWNLATEVRRRGCSGILPSYKQCRELGHVRISQCSDCNKTEGETVVWAMIVEGRKY